MDLEAKATCFSGIKLQCKGTNKQRTSSSDIVTKRIYEWMIDEEAGGWPVGQRDYQNS